MASKSNNTRKSTSKSTKTKKSGKQTTKRSTAKKNTGKQPDQSFVSGEITILVSFCS